MSYSPPVQPFAPAPYAPRPQGAALPGLAVILLLNLVLQVAVLVFDLNRAGASYLEYALWGHFDTKYGYLPAYFTPYDTAMVVALAVMVVAGFSGRAWIRAGGTVLLLVGGFAVAVNEIELLTSSSEGREAFGSPVVPNLLLNLDQLAQAGLALVFALVVAATKGGTAVLPAPLPPMGGPAYGVPPAMPVPPQQPPVDRPGFGAPTPPPPVQPPMPPAQQPWGSPRPEAGGGYPPQR
jgi:hypothetical protein